MKQFRKIAAFICLLLGSGSLQGKAQEFQPDLQRLALMMLSEMATGDVDDMPYLAYLDSLGFKKSDTDLTLGKLKFGGSFYKKGIGKDTVQVEVRNMEINKGKISRSVKIKSTSDSILCRMVEQLQAFGMEEVEKNNIVLVLADNGLVAGKGEKILILRCEFTPSQSYIERPVVSDDGKGRMDTINNSIVCRIETIDKIFIDTLVSGETGIDIYPKYIHSFTGKGGCTVYLFVYSMGHLFFYDEAAVYAVMKNGDVERRHFISQDRRDTKLGCMWWDQLVAASNGFPYDYEDSPDEERYGIHCVLSLRSLYIPIMDHHDSGSEFANTSCLQYTGRFDVFRFNGIDFWYDGTDGAWWLNPDLRNYKRTVSNKKSVDGIEQIDLMLDGTYRRTYWKGARTLDDLRKTPDEVKISKDISK
jgi:hypothetical protein